MSEQILRCELTEEQVGYLTESSILKDVLDDLTIGDQCVVEGSRDAIERLRERLTELLAKVGFDIDYSPTPEGELIERIIDALYAP
jgi:polyhydroxyalkanoate synthesis regulator phasin